MTKTCLDLFCGLGGFSAAFVDSDNWDVVTVDIEEEFDPDIQADVMGLRPSDLPDADVVLASPPCKQFSLAGNHENWDAEEEKPVAPESKEAVVLTFHALGLIRALSPRYWFLENPRGRMRWILGEPEGTVTYCQYGEDYQKPTDLWGEHPGGFEYRSCAGGDDCHASNHEDDGTSAVASMPSVYGVRSMVPEGLSWAVLEAVEGRGEQQTLEGVCP
jgi:hypothetical protein